MASVREYAHLSKHVYNPNSYLFNQKDFVVSWGIDMPNKNIGTGWRYISDLPGAIPLGLNYYAALYMKFEYGRPVDAVIAIRGTVAEIANNDVVDMVSWFSDVFGEGHGDKLPAYLGVIWRFVLTCFGEIIQRFPHIRLTLTGHSLGGALAQLIPLKYFIIPAVVFNSPGCGHMPGILLSNHRSIHNVNSTYGFINKIGATVGEVFCVDIPEDEPEAKTMMWQFSTEENATANAIEELGDDIGGLVGDEVKLVGGEIKFDNYYQSTEVLSQFVPSYQYSALAEPLSPFVAMSDAVSRFSHKKAELALMAKTIVAQHSIANMVATLSHEPYGDIARMVF